MRLDGADWPIFGWTTDMRPSLARARSEKRSVVLGTLIRADGPSPRPVGSQMVFQAAAATGYFSGGCLEADVANHAQAVLGHGEPLRLVYGKDSPWIDIRLLCGGSIEIMLERIDPADRMVGRLLRIADDRCRSWWMSDGRSRSVRLDPPATSARVAGGGYVLRYDPAWRIVVVGGDPIALAIASLSISSGFETTIVRPAGPAGPPPFPGVAYLREDATTAIEQLAPDRWTAIISATHDDLIDDGAIVAALRAETGYVGVLGSATRVRARRERLLAAGIPVKRVAALHAPIGAVRSGKAPWEVAVSVVGEVMQVRSDQARFDTAAGDDAAARYEAIVRRLATVER